MNRDTFIQVLGEYFHTHKAFADKHGYSLEIADFAMPRVLNSESEYTKKERFYREELEGYDRKLTLHGSFIDVHVFSPDVKIREVSRQRVIRNLETARELGAEAVVFHTNFVPLIKNPGYIDNWIKNNAPFWKAIIEEYSIEILLENMWDADTEHLQKLLADVDSPLLKVCFDIGHFNVFSNVSLEKWFTCFADSISHIHLNDNKGNLDQHLPLGEGTIDWQGYNRAVTLLKTNPRVVLEVKGLDAIRHSMDYLSSNFIYPYNGGEH